MNTAIRFRYRGVTILVLAGLLGGCAVAVDRKPLAPFPGEPTLTPQSAVFDDLTRLPPPAGKVGAAVYGFRDQTGQYKPSPASSFSTAVTQGAASMLIKALIDSDWFVPVEREGLSDLLTERKIVRAAQEQSGKADLPPLASASVLLTGGIVAYDTNVKTGGEGARYFGLGVFDEYRMDQVTVNLRAVDIRTGRILASVSTSKSIFSHGLSGGGFRFVRFKRMLELEAGYTRNEPAQLCVRDAIESAVVHLIARGIDQGLWQLRYPDDLNTSVLRAYLDANSLGVE